jgi:peptide/nickel transport system substrate-binding protein
MGTLFRRTSRLPAISMAAVLFLWSCAPHEESGSDSADVPQRQRYGGTLVVAHSSDVVSLSPVRAVDIMQQELLRDMLMTPVLRITRDLHVEQGLARRWEVSEDSTELRLQLREDVFWHDGVRTTAHDLAFGLRAVAQAGGVGEDVLPTIQVLDSFSLTVSIVPETDFLNAWAEVYALPRHLFAGVAPAEIPRHPASTLRPVGNGPFRVVERVPGDRWVFEAVDDYPAELGGRSYVDRVVLRAVSDLEEIVSGLLSGAVDYAPRIPPSATPRLADTPGVRLLSSVGRGYVFTAWNQRRPHLRDVRVRRALTMAIDRQAIVDSLHFGFGQVGNSTVAPYHWAHDASLSAELAYDPEGARTLLEEAGWMQARGDPGFRTNGRGEPLRIRMLTGTRNGALMDVLRGYLAAVGVELLVELAEMNELMERASPGRRDYDAVTVLLVSSIALDQRPGFHCDTRNTSIFQLSGYCDAETDRLLEAIGGSSDRATARPLWIQVQRRLTSDVPVTVLYYQENVSGVSDRLRDVQPDVRGVLFGLREWWIDPARR